MLCICRLFTVPLATKWENWGQNWIFSFEPKKKNWISHIVPSGPVWRRPPGSGWYLTWILDGAPCPVERSKCCRQPNWFPPQVVEARSVESSRGLHTIHTAKYFGQEPDVFYIRPYLSVESTLSSSTWHILLMASVTLLQLALDGFLYSSYLILEAASW